MNLYTREIIPAKKKQVRAPSNSRWVELRRFGDPNLPYLVFSGSGGFHEFARYFPLSKACSGFVSIAAITMGHVLLSELSPDRDQLDIVTLRPRNSSSKY